MKKRSTLIKHKSGGAQDRNLCVAASLAVYKVADMTPRGRRRVSAWLRKLADGIEKEPESFAKTFRARYMYEPKAGAPHAA